jgi:hypothetical protein
MPKVEFTSRVTTEFGGFYSAGRYNARAGDVYDLSEAEISRLHRDHPGLIEALDKAEKPRTRTKPTGKDRKMHGGRTK